MLKALSEAGIDLENGDTIDVVNCDASGTRQGDRAEAMCIKSILNK